MTLLTWGQLQFEVYPVNIHELDHLTDTDWARKEVLGAAIYREWVGENDEEITIRGRLFPYRLGGLSELDLFEAYRRAGMAEQLLRGTNPATNLGWYVCERLARSHRFLGGDGVGQQINFEATFARCPVPDPNDYYPQIYRLVQGGDGGGVGGGAPASQAANQARENLEA